MSTGGFSRNRRKEAIRYTVLEHESENGFVVSVPVLPGCVSQGDTREEALNNIREAIELYVEDCRLAGDPVPKKIPWPGTLS
jgi:predicted RNase H-like HicB family nuclease